MRDIPRIDFVAELQQLASHAVHAWMRHQMLPAAQKAAWGDGPLDASLNIHRHLAMTRWRQRLRHEQ